MSEANSFDSLILDDLMTCWFCRRNLVEPKLLPCQHSCCVECLKVNLSSPDFTFSCPSCASHVEVKNGDVNKLPDTYLYNIIQEQRAATVKANKKCKPCRVENKVTQASYQCLDCPDAFCSGCKKFHFFSSQTENHRVVKIRDIQKGKYDEQMKQTKMKICSKHSGEEKQFLKFYCKDCQSLVCQHCVLLEHKSHTCITLDVFYDKALSDIIYAVKPLEDKQEREALNHGNLYDAAYRLKNEKETAEKLVYEATADLHNLVDDVKADKLLMINQLYEQQMKHIKETKRKMQRMQKRTNATMCFADAFLYYGSKVDFACHSKDVESRVKECIDRKAHYTITTKHLVIENKPCNIAKDIIDDMLGKVSLTENTKKGKKNKEVRFSNVRYGERQLQENPVYRNDKTVPKLKEKYDSQVLFDNESGMGFAYGLAEMTGNDLIAVGGTKIGVFSNDGTLKKWIHCKDLQFAYDVTVKGQLIYITDIARGQRKVLVMNPEGIVQNSVIMPSCEQEYQSYSLGLAIDENDYLFIGSYKTSTVYVCPPCPKAIQPEPFLTKASNPGLNEPLYLCLTPKQELIVSTYGSNNIQAYNMKGQPLWQYDGKVIGNGEMAINVPYGMCCDGEGNVYVCDHYNNRIQVVKDGTHIGFIQPHNLLSPQALTVNSDDELVIIMPNRILKVKLR